MKLVTLKDNNSVTSFRKDKFINYVILLLHCKAEDLYFHYQ